MKILFIFPRWTKSYGLMGYFAHKASTWPPLNLAYLAAIAINHGHDAAVLDAEAERLTSKDLVEKIKAFQPHMIGLTATTPFFHIVKTAAQEIKRLMPAVPIMIGGPHITLLKESAFEECFDYGVLGEAEEVLPAFLDRWEKDADFSDVKGILYRDAGRTRYTGFPDHIANIDTIPWPARHLLPVHAYRMGTLEGTKTFTTIMTMRGCPFKCIFCSTKVFGNRIRKRRPQSVVDEMIDIVERFGIRHFIFLDDTLTVDRDHILEICHLIQQAGLKITFEGSTRANLIDEELIKTMTKAGLIRMSFGLESTDPQIRKIMRKEVPLDSYRTANRLTNKYGIETLNSCMIGLPGETIQSIRNTLHFLRQSREIKQANLSIAIPYPGTALYSMAKAGDHGLEILTEDFSRYRRYNSAVMNVGSLKAEELIRLQNDAIVSIYMAPWRIIPVFKKSGIMGVLLTLKRFLLATKRILRNQDGLFFFKDGKTPSGKKPGSLPF